MLLKYRLIFDLDLRKKFIKKRYALSFREYLIELLVEILKQLLRFFHMYMFW